MNHPMHYNDIGNELINLKELNNYKNYYLFLFSQILFKSQLNYSLFLLNINASSYLWAF